MKMKIKIYWPSCLQNIQCILYTGQIWFADSSLSSFIFSWLVWYFHMVWWINNGVLKKSCGRWNTATWQRVIQQHNSPHWQLFKYHSNQVFECFLMWGGYHKIKPVLAVSMTVNQLWGPKLGSRQDIGGSIYGEILDFWKSRNTCNTWNTCNTRNTHLMCWNH